jgi:methyl-accepting chemotaxis protein
MTTASAAVHRRVEVAEAQVEAVQAALSGAAAAIVELDRSSGELAGMTAAVEEIAAQAQLLAMTAGVEAARAGDAGRGFAVIAAEMRALAQRSVATTREIKAVVDRSSRQAAGGARVVDDGHAALRRVSAEVAEVRTAMTDIAGTAREQERGLRQIGKLAATLEYEAREGAGLCQRAASAGTDLVEDAAGQLRLVRRFRIERQPKVAAPPRRRPLTVVRLEESPQPGAPREKRPVVPFRVIDGGLAERRVPG